MRLCDQDLILSVRSPINMPVGLQDGSRPTHIGIITRKEERQQVVGVTAVRRHATSQKDKDKQIGHPQFYLTTPPPTFSLIYAY